MKVMIVDHQGKSKAIARALAGTDCELVRDATVADAGDLDRSHAAENLGLYREYIRYPFRTLLGACLALDPTSGQAAENLATISPIAA
ncbi:MAG TPA: hypothetical protein VH063_19065 [Gaiellaceae bacterium]|jgi:hypothetical protein|nr:hypothetical protein [Gaiellaceae bacterium]